MLKLNRDVEEAGVLHAAELICVAARTAPKGKGKDLLITAVVTGAEKSKLCARMEAIAERDGMTIFTRDAANVAASSAVVLLATRKDPLGLPHCGYCGFADCGAMTAAGGTCSFNTGDLGIAIGSAVSRAADLRLDNRVMYTAGKAALELGLLGSQAAIAYGLPLSATGKSPFFDRY